MGVWRYSGRGLVMLVVLCMGCGPALTFRMVRPQVSAVNHFIGPDLEVSFVFQDASIDLILRNSGDTDLAVDWSQASFVGADGRAVPLVSTGQPLIGTLPLGSVTEVSLRPSEYGYAGGSIWHRRAFLERRLVPPSLLEKCSPMVRLLLPVMRYAQSRAEFEMHEFIFQVQAARGDEAQRGQDGFDF
jgi:hypothetical protein